MIMSLKAKFIKKREKFKLTKYDFLTNFSLVPKFSLKFTSFSRATKVEGVKERAKHNSI